MPESNMSALPEGTKVASRIKVKSRKKAGLLEGNKTLKLINFYTII